MAPGLDGGRAVTESQNSAHGHGHDYTTGSPHLRHAAIRARLDDHIHEAIGEILRRQSRCDVLEVGAGHGFFTDTVLRAGGTPTVTEMSEASFEFLKQRFDGVPDVDVVFDPDGQEAIRLGRRYDVVLLISVIHHIPDYLGAVTTICDALLRPGGSVLTFQDPLWYPRQSAYERAISQGAYLAWRLTQGEFRRGLATRWRRLRGVYDDTAPSDLVEYHVVRQGVDDHALVDLFDARFESVDVFRYFSTQSPIIQRFGGNSLPHNTFGLLAKRRIAVENHPKHE